MSAQAQPKLLFVVQEDPDGGFTAQSPGYGIYTQGETTEEQLANIKEAILCHFEEGSAPDSFIVYTIKRRTV